MAARPLVWQAQPQDLTEPVRRLRASAQRLGLLRVNRVRLLVTKAGTALRDDPVLLWRHVAERLVGKPKAPFAPTAAALVLVSAAAAGWTVRGGTGVHRYAVTSAAGYVGEVLDVDGAYEGRRRVTSARRVLARAALRSG